jgi:hypothetical protein
MPGSKQLLWAVILGQSEGVSRLFAKRADGKCLHTLASAVENAEGYFFEAVNVSQFPVGQADLQGIGTRLQALAEDLSNEEFRSRFFPTR